MRIILNHVLSLLLVGCASVDKSEILEMNAKKYSYNEVVQFNVGQKLQFPDFSITYLKEVDPEAGSEIKSTRSIRIRHFKITENAGDTSEVQIYHGQLPPRPYELNLKSGRYIINTFTSSKGERLFESKLEVVKI